MHLQTLVSFLPLLASLTAGQTTDQAHSLYKDACPQKDGQEENAGNNVYVTYHCDQRPSSGKSTVVQAENPRHCARICASQSNCESSTWSGKKLRSQYNGHCVLYQTHSNILKHDSDVVYMTHRVEDDPFGDDDDPFGSDCQDERSHINNLEENIKDLKHELAECKKDCSGCFQCPDYNRRLYNDRGHTYKVYCGKLDDHGAANLNFYGAKTPKECVEACTDTQDCTRAIWPTALASNAKGGCWLREYTDKAGPVPKTDSVYSSAHLQ